MPQPEELHIVVFDKPDGAQIVQLLLGKAQGAQVVDLGVDLVHHLLGKHHALVAALKVVLAVQVRVLMEDHLIHIEFIQVGVQQRNNNRFQLHSLFPFQLAASENCFLRFFEVPCYMLFVSRLPWEARAICRSCRYRGQSFGLV